MAEQENEQATAEGIVQKPSTVRIADDETRWNRAKAPRDLLGSRFQIKTDSPLDSESPLKATTFPVIDKRGEFPDLYCRVLDTSVPYRMQAIAAYERIKLPILQKLVAYGNACLSTVNEFRMVLVFEQIDGKKLSEVQNITRSWNSKTLLANVISPIAKLIESLEEFQVVMGHLNSDTVYLDKSGQIVISEFISQPCGFNQKPLYETLDRLICNPMGKGEGTGVVDLFALGSLVIHTNLGIYPSINDMTPEELINHRMMMGSYNTFMGNRELGADIEDFVRGVVNDTHGERWKIAQVNSWLSGRKFNIIRPSPPKESSRAYTYNSHPYFNRKHLAFGLSSNWVNARKEIADIKIMRWTQLSIGKPETAEQLKQVFMSTGGDSGRNPQQEDELVARSLIVLDPAGPIRLKDISTKLDGIGPLLCDYSRQNRNDSINMINKLVEMDIINFYFDINGEPDVYWSETLIAKLDKYRHIVTNKTLGFGLERVVYDLNPTLPCQSIQVKKDHVLTLDDLLLCLDAKGQSSSGEIDIVDRHIAAFIASKIDVEGEIKLPSVERNPAFRKSQLLFILVLFNRAQKKAGRPNLPGLANFFAQKLQSLVNFYHGKEIKRLLQEALKDAAQSGNLDKIVKVITDPAIIEKDQLDFEKAVHTFKQNKAFLAKSQDMQSLQARAHRISAKTSLILSYIALGMVFLRVAGNIRGIGF